MTTKKLTARQRYAGSPLEASNERICAALAEIHPEWSAAWRAMLCQSGPRYGRPPLRKPGSRRDKYGTQGVLWEAWNHARGSHEAGRWGFTANMSVFGAFGSLMFCDRADSREAYITCERAIEAEFNRPRAVKSITLEA